MPPTRLHLSPLDAHIPLMDATTPEFAYTPGTPVAAWQRRLRPRLARLLGFDKMPQGDGRPPLAIRSLWRRADFRGLGSVEKIVFTAERGADVPAYVCLPANVQPPYSWAICLQGHSTGMHNSIAVDRADETTPIEAEGDRDFALSALRQGFAALCIEQRGFGARIEHPEAAPNTDCYDMTMRALMLGRTAIGERVYDVDRGLDYLATRPDVDWQRVGVLGNSGGGTVTTYAAALLPRLRFAIPSCAVCTFRDSIMTIHHCSCNHVPGIYAVADMAEIAGLFAPRPMVVVAGSQDDIFPLRGVRRSYRDLRAIYRGADAERHCALVVGDGGHRFFADAAWAALRRMIG